MLRLCRRFLSFRGCGVVPELCERLEALGITTPTTVQAKSLESVLEGKHVVINAETGSGKTLCYLLPVVQALHQLRGQGSSHPPTPYSLVLVPTPDLAIQVCNVFTSIAGSLFGCTACYSGSRPTITSHTHLLVAIPRSLMTYDLSRLLGNVRMVCVDEVDALVTGGERKAVWEVLNSVRALHHRDNQREKDTQRERGAQRQLVMVAATLPQGGPQTAGSMLAEWMPQGTLYITTHLTHHTVSSSQHTFTHLTTPTSSETTPTTTLTEEKLSQLERDLSHLHGNQTRILVFTNTQATADLVYNHLMEVGVVTTGTWWAGHVGCLMSRGIDLPELTAVIQFDFPENSAHYLHRAGRTARAGREGKVISYTVEGDSDLAREIETVLDDRSKSFQQIFSRNKMLRRRMNYHKAKEREREQ